SPGHSVPVRPSVRRKPKPYLRSCVPPSPFRNELASTFAVCCGRRLRLWLNDPYDVPVKRSRPAFVLMPPSAVSTKPVLSHAYFPDTNRFELTTRSSANFQRPCGLPLVYALPWCNVAVGALMVMPVVPGLRLSFVL